MHVDIMRVARQGVEQLYVEADADTAAVLGELAGQPVVIAAAAPETAESACECHTGDDGDIHCHRLHRAGPRHVGCTDAVAVLDQRIESAHFPKRHQSRCAAELGIGDLLAAPQQFACEIIGRYLVAGARIKQHHSRPRQLGMREQSLEDATSGGRTLPLAERAPSGKRLLAQRTFGFGRGRSPSNQVFLQRGFGGHHQRVAEGLGPGGFLRWRRGAVPIIGHIHPWDFRIAMNAPVDVSPYVARRGRLFAAIGDGIAIVPTAPEVARNRDSHYPYRHDSYFYYLTGFREPEAVLVLLGGEECRSILFCREKDEEREIWDGFRVGVELAREAFRVDEAHPITSFEAKLPDLLRNRPAVYAPLAAGGPHGTAWDALLARAIQAVRGMARAGVAAPTTLCDVCAILDDMRLVKDEHEIALMRRAAAITAQAHRRAMQSARPGQWEYEVEAEIAHEFIRSGARSPAYNHIVASGPNACVLHYNESSRRMQAGDLLLIDAGCEYEGYAADITRTFPVSGRFSGPQSDIYQAVLQAQLACMDALRPGEPFHRYHDVATESLSRALIELGLLGGSLDEVLAEKSYQRFYMHRAGHWLGMDVHDAGAYRVRGESQILRPGMVVTNEPGLYIRPHPDVPEHFWNIGVRIEDDVLITRDGHEVLTALAPKTASEVEAACTR